MATNALRLSSMLAFVLVALVAANARASSLDDLEVLTYDLQPVVSLPFFSFIAPYSSTHSTTGAKFGQCLALTPADGDVALVATAPSTRVNNSLVGSAFLFAFDWVLEETTWQLVTPEIDQTYGAQNFGRACGLSESGRHAVISSSADIQTSGFAGQKVYVYTRSADQTSPVTWTRTATFGAGDFTNGTLVPYFALSVGFFNQTLLVGSIAAARVETASFSEATMQWTADSPITSPVNFSCAFGFVVATALPYLAVGCPSFTGLANSRFAVFNGSGASFAFESALELPPGITTSLFGFFVAVSAEPTPVIVVGVPDAALVLVYTRTAATASWQFANRIHSVGFGVDSFFGSAVALDPIAATLVVGAPNAFQFDGAALSFRFVSGDDAACAAQVALNVTSDWSAGEPCFSFVKSLAPLSVPDVAFGPARGLGASVAVFNATALVGMPDFSAGGLLAVFGRTESTSNFTTNLDALLTATSFVVQAGVLTFQVTPRGLAGDELRDRLLGGDTVTVWAVPHADLALPNVSATVVARTHQPYEASLLLARKGAYRVFVQVNALVSQVALTVDHGPVNALSSLLSGAGALPVPGASGTPLLVRIALRDVYDNELDSSYDAIFPTAVVASASVASLSAIAATSTIVPAGDNALEFTYVPPIYGSYTVRVLLNGAAMVSAQVEILASCDVGLFARTPIGPCLVCPAGHFSPGGNASSCTSCPELSTTSSTEPAATALSCLCFEGYFSLAGAGTACEPCPPYAVCPGGLDAPIAQPGAFQVSARLFVACSPVSACLGGLNNTCARGYEGVECGTCSDGFYRAAGECRKCDGASNALFGVMFLIGVGVAAAFLVMAVLSNHGRSGPKQRARQITWSFASISAIVNFCQMAGVVASVPALWPTPVAKLLRGFIVFNLIDVGLFAPACALKPDFYRTYLISVCAPLYLLFCIAMLVLVVFVVHRVTMRVGLLTFWTTSDDIQVFVSRTSVLSVFLALPFIYIGITRSTLSFFACRQRADRNWYLGDDTTNQCFTSRWYSMLPVAIAATLAWPLGLPLLVLLVLVRYRALMSDQTVLARFGSIYRLYSPELSFWEVVVMLKKLALVAIQLLFTSHLLQIALLLALFGLAAMVQLHMRPFYRRRHNRISAIVDCSVMLVLFCGLIFYSDKLPNAYTRDIFTVSTFVVVGGALLLLLSAAAEELHGNMIIMRVADGGFSIGDFKRDAVLGVLRPLVMGRLRVNSVDEANELFVHVAQRLDPSVNVSLEPLATDDQAVEF